MNIVLVGLMGAGKSTIGKQLAKKLKWRFIDSDQLIEAKTGVSISTIFDIEGELGFREREAATFQELLSIDRTVLATGGGSILSKDNRQALKQIGTVVYLSATARQLYQRIQFDKSRPLIQGDDALAKLTSLLAIRDPLYREVADIVVDTRKDNINTTTAQILNDTTALRQP